MAHDWDSALTPLASEWWWLGARWATAPACERSWLLTTLCSLTCATPTSTTSTSLKGEGTLSFCISEPDWDCQSRNGYFTGGPQNSDVFLTSKILLAIPNCRADALYSLESSSTSLSCLVNSTPTIPSGDSPNANHFFTGTCRSLRITLRLNWWIIPSIRAACSSYLLDDSNAPNNSWLAPSNFNWLTRF